MISAQTALMLTRAASTHYESLLADGCDKDVALDRTWDAFECAVNQSSTHCYDSRDRLLENRLRTVINREEHK